MNSKIFLLVALLPVVMAGQSSFPFQLGERLLYEATFNLIMVGNSELSIASIDTVDNFPTYRIIFEVRSNPIADRIFKVRDKVETWIDEKGLFTRKIKKKIREGVYRKKSTVTIDYTDSLLRADSKTFKIDQVIRDPYSLFYYLRTIPLKVGDLLSFTTFDNNKFTDFQVTVHYKEKVKVPAGEFNCFVIKPFRAERSLFKSRGEMTIWLSDDAQRLPVKIKSKATFGSMVLKLRKVTR